jgi:uncharacterized protein
MSCCLAARWPRPVAIGIPAVIFAGLHLGMPHATVFAVLTDIGFAIALAGLFFWAGPQRSLAAPVGLHTAWNVLIAIVLGLPLTGEASTWAVVRHEGGDQLWAGGEYGLEGGLAGLFAVLLVIAVTLAFRARHIGASAS